MNDGGKQEGARCKARTERRLDHLAAVGQDQPLQVSQAPGNGLEGDVDELRAVRQVQGLEFLAALAQGLDALHPKAAILAVRQQVEARQVQVHQSFAPLGQVPHAHVRDEPGPLETQPRELVAHLGQGPDSLCGGGVGLGLVGACWGLCVVGKMSKQSLPAFVSLLQFSKSSFRSCLQLSVSQCRPPSVRWLQLVSTSSCNAWHRSPSASKATSVIFRPGFGAPPRPNNKHSRSWQPCDKARTPASDTCSHSVRSSFLRSGHLAVRGIDRWGVVSGC